MHDGADVAVVGGGVIGLALARELALRGCGTVVVVDRGEPGGEASGAAAGLLSVAATRARGGALFDLRRRSAELYAPWVRAIEEESGLDVEYRRDGVLAVAFGRRNEERLRQRVEKRIRQGLAARLLQRAELQDAEPGVSARARCGALFADDATVHPARLTGALRRAAEARGVRIRVGAPLERVDGQGDRVTSIVAGGERLNVGHVVLAAGAASAEVGRLFGVKIPVRPDRGELLALRPAVMPRRALCSGEGYLVPRRDGAVVVGGTSARGETDKRVSARSLALLAGRAVYMMPGMRDAAVVRMWAGLRPSPSIRRPLIGPIPRYANVSLATGHDRAGILLAPVTARILSEWITTGASSIPLAPFKYRAR